MSMAEDPGSLSRKWKPAKKHKDVAEHGAGEVQHLDATDVSSCSYDLQLFATWIALRVHCFLARALHRIPKAHLLRYSGPSPTPKKTADRASPRRHMPGWQMQTSMVQKGGGYLFCLVQHSKQLPMRGAFADRGQRPLTAAGGCGWKH